MFRRTNNERHPSRIALALGVAGLLGLVGCAGDGGSADPAEAGSEATDAAMDPEGNYSVGVLQHFVANLTPGAGSDSFINRALFTSLTDVDPETSQIEMAVAETVESTDQQEWTVTIKDGWTFTDGSPVTAQSFADAWNATALGSNGWIGNYQFSIIEGYADLNPLEGEPSTLEMSGLSVIDEQTLAVRLNEPNSMFPYIISSNNFAPMPSEAFEDLEAFSAKPVGNGPFMIEGEGVGPGVQELTLVRNDTYAGDRALAAQVDVKLYQDANSMYTSFQGGAIDVALVDGTNLSDAQTRYPDQLVEVSYPAVVYLGFPLWDERFQDESVRRAFAQAIDRDVIAESLLRGSADPATSLAPNSLLGAEGLACEICAFDLDQAQQDLGSWSGPLSLYTTDDPAQGQVLEAIANGFRSILDIEDISTEQQAVSQIYTNLGEQTLDGPFLLYTGVSVPHLFTMTNNLFGPTFFNVTGYSSETVNAALGQAAASGSAEEVITMTHDAAAQGLQDASLTPVYFPKGGLVFTDRVMGVSAEILGGPRLAGIGVN